eukprot:1161846-Pelagomonas_calceolata.AAC.7
MGQCAGPGPQNNYFQPILHPKERKEHVLSSALRSPPLVACTSAAEPQQSPPASLPTAFANSMGNNFAQRMAAAKEQPRVSMHSAQPEPMPAAKEQLCMTMQSAQRVMSTLLFWHHVN